METNLKFNSQICTTRSQSERLLALGLKKNTADCYYYAQQRWTGNSYENTGELFLSPLWDINDKGHFQYLNEVFGDEIGEEDTPYVLPAWSLHRLIEMIPDKIAYPTIYDSAPLRIDKDSMYYLYRFFDKYGDEDFSTIGDNEAIGSHNVYDYAVSVIGFLIKEGHFNKEYLEE